jgi:hypothetical protein
MTHSLHRRGDYESLKEDFVVLGRYENRQHL